LEKKRLKDGIMDYGIRGMKRKEKKRRDSRRLEMKRLETRKD